MVGGGFESGLLPSILSENAQLSFIICAEGGNFFLKPKVVKFQQEYGSFGDQIAKRATLIYFTFRTNTTLAGHAAGCGGRMVARIRPRGRGAAGEEVRAHGLDGKQYLSRLLYSCYGSRCKFLITSPK